MPKAMSLKEKKDDALSNSSPYKVQVKCSRKGCDEKWTLKGRYRPDELPEDLPCRRRGCGGPTISTLLRTPYQGGRRCFGYYTCNGCDNAWSSAFCWANTYQQCLNCNRYVYPQGQRKLLRSGATNPEKHHLSDRCGKCDELGPGRSCNGGR